MINRAAKNEEPGAQEDVEKEGGEVRRQAALEQQRLRMFGHLDRYDCQSREP